MVYGTYKQIDLEHEQLYVYEREKNDQLILVISNFTKDKTKYNLNNYEISEILLSNYDNTTINKKIIEIRPYESVVLKARRL